MNPLNFPAKLRSLPQWVTWKREIRNGKTTKVLYSPKGYGASTTKPESWGSFEECVAASTDTELYDGIGFVFTKGIVGIDLDHCLNEDGTIKQWAKDVLNLFDSYTEISPSGKGLHLVFESDVEFGGHKREWLNDLDEKEGIECYMRSRYFTVTGNVFDNLGELKRIDETKILDWRRNTFPETPVAVPVTPTIVSPPTDEEIINRMRQARNGPRFSALFDRGDFKSQGFPSQSEADMSLVNSLMFFSRNDAPTVDRLFRQSGLMRPKWDRDDYRSELLKKCFRLQIMDWSRPTECDEPEDELVIRSLAGIKPVNVRWLWRSRLAKGKLTLFQGDPGQGKSQVTIYIAAVISKGDVFVDDLDSEPGQVLFITAEDDAADTLKPRLMAQDANMDNIFELQWIKTAQGKTKLFNFERYMEELKRAAKNLTELKLIVVDPISAFMGKTDINSSSEVRGLLYELQTIAEERECAVILVTHNNKNSSQRAVSRATGSHAFVAGPRMSYVFGLHPPKDGEQPVEGECAMAPLKNNLTRNPLTLVYVIKPDTVFGENDEAIETSKIEWRGTSSATAQEIVDYQPYKPTDKSGRPDTRFQQCVEQMKQLIGDKVLLNNDFVKMIKRELAGYTEQMIKKSRSYLGFEAFSLGYESEWKKTKLSLDEQFDNF